MAEGAPGDGDVVDVLDAFRALGLEPVAIAPIGAVPGWRSGRSTLPLIYPAEQGMFWLLLAVPVGGRWVVGWRWTC